jgi:signal transduction histidine kinase
VVIVERYGAEQWEYSRRRNGAAADSISERHIVPAIRALEQLADRLQDEVSRNAQVKASDAERSAREASVMSVYFITAAGLGVLGIAAWLTRSIGRPVEELERGMAAVAAGSFGHRLQIARTRRDELGRLAASFEQMAERLAELDRLKAEFVSVASHELKTPVNVILGYVTLLQDGLYGDVAATQREVLGTIEGQARSLGRLVQHLLDVSRFQAGAARLDLRPLALHPFLAEVERSYRVLAVQRDVGFTVTASGLLPEVVTWDRDRMTEVLGNLLSNGFKFTPARGRVEVTVTALPVTEGGGGERIHVEVRDTGVGIAAEELPHIFGKFFQADNQSVATTPGSGLGLAISKEIVEAHGGTITVDSTVGVGTRFSILVPAHAQPRATDVARTRVAERGAVAALPPAAGATVSEG